MVSDCFDAIPIPRLGQHCTGWQSAARVHSALYLEYHRSWGHSGYLGGQSPDPLVPPISLFNHQFTAWYGWTPNQMANVRQG